MATNAISALGAGSGMDVKALATSLVDAEKAPRKDIIDKKISKSEAKISGYSAIRYVLDQLKTAFEGLNNQSDFNGVKVFNSQTAAFSATGSAAAAAGSHSIIVKSLAAAQRSVSDAGLAYSSADQALNLVSDGNTPPTSVNTAFNLTLKVGSGADQTIAVSAANATPAGVVSAINDANLGISAQLLKTDTGYQILTTGKTGADNSFTLSSGIGLNFGVVSGQTARNATLNVDGLDISRSSNQIDDAIAGVTLDIFGTTNAVTNADSSVSYSPATVNLTRDTSSVKAQVRQLVAAYNDVESVLKDVYNKDSKVDIYGASLVGDSSVQAIRNQVRAMVVDNASPTTSSTSSIRALRDLGVAIDMTGQLQIDESKLDTALSSHFDDAVKLLSNNIGTQYVGSADAAGIAGDAIKTLTTLLGKDGLLVSQSNNASKRIDDYKLELEKLNDRMTKLLERYNKQFGAMESIVGQSNSLRTSLTSTFEGMMATYTNG